MLEEGAAPNHLLRVVWVIHKCVIAIDPVVEELALPGASYLRNWDHANPVTLGSVVCACVECDVCMCGVWCVHVWSVGRNEVVRQHTFPLSEG